MRFSTFVQGLAASGSEAWAIHFRAQQRARAGDDVIILSVGDPDFDTPRGIIDACKDALDAGATKYSNAGGIPELTKAISDWETERLGRTVDPAQVVVTAGAQNALYVTMRCILEAGDEAILLAPPYVMFDGVVLSTGATPVHVPLRTNTDFSIDVDALAKAITPRTRAVLMNSPHNPSGAVAPKETVQAVAELCRRHGIWMISDEVYADLCFESSFHSPYELYGAADNLVVIRSLSKSHAMSGWRVGWILGPEPLCEHARNLLNSMQYGGSAFVQHAAAHALSAESGALDTMKQAYRTRRDIVVENLRNVPGLSVLRPDSGIFCLLRVDGLGMDGSTFAEGLLDAQGVSVLPGAAFGRELTDFVRVSLCQPEPVLEEAMARIRTFAIGQRP